MALTWYLCDLKSGAVVADLPLRPSGSIERTIGRASSLSVSLDVHDPSCPANWADLVDLRRAMFVLDSDGSPLVGYIPTADSAGPPSATWSLTSLESALDEVNVRTYDFYEGADDEANVAATLLSDVIGPSWGFEVVTTPTGKTADHSYAFEEDRTVGSAINDLAMAEGGPEWTIRLSWVDPERRQRIKKTIYIAPKIGNDLPAVVVENIHLQQRTRNTSAARGDLATYVIAVSDGSGPSRPMSAAHVDQAALDSGVPQREVRVQVAAIDDDAQLDRVAVAALGRRRAGLRTWEMELAPHVPGCPMVGRDFDAGDTIKIESGPMQHDPASWYAMARVIGWRADIDATGNLSTVTPVFWQEPEEGTQS